MYQVLLVMLPIASTFADGPGFQQAFIMCGGQYPSVDLNVFNDFCEPSFKTSDNSTKCLIKCVGEQTGFSGADGKINQTMFMNVTSSLPPIDPATLNAGVAKCSSLATTDTCDTAYQQWNCYCGLASGSGN